MDAEPLRGSWSVIYCRVIGTDRVSSTVPFERNSNTKVALPATSGPGKEFALFGFTVNEMTQLPGATVWLDGHDVTAPPAEAVFAPCVIDP